MNKKGGCKQRASFESHNILTLFSNVLYSLQNSRMQETSRKKNLEIIKFHENRICTIQINNKISQTILFLSLLRILYFLFI